MVGWTGNFGADTDATHALQWLAEGAAVFRYAGQPALPSPLVFLDVETTRDHIVEVAAVRLQRGAWPVAWHSWIDPGPAARYRTGRYWNTDIHGLTAPIVQGAPTFAQVAPSLWQLLGDATLVAHNAAFEHAQLSRAFASVGTVWSRPALCTLKLSRRLLPRRKQDGSGYTLEELAPALHIRNPAPHRAMGDVMCTVWLLLALMERCWAAPGLAEALQDAHRLGT
ncbi:MAG: 3'-5' exonuclease [Myxococcota bacterium]